MDLAAGALLGVAASLVAWLLINHALRPKLQVSPFVSRSLTASGQVSYRIKIRNPQRRRGLADVQVDAYLWLPGYWKDKPDTPRIVDVPVSSDELVGMRPGDNRILVLDLSAPIRQNKKRLENGDLDAMALESLLALGRGQEAELRLWAAFTDAYSGIRRADFHRYRIPQIEPYLFAQGSVSRGSAAPSATSA